MYPSVVEWLSEFVQNFSSWNRLHPAVRWMWLWMWTLLRSLWRVPASTLFSINNSNKFHYSTGCLVAKICTLLSNYSTIFGDVFWWAVSSQHPRWIFVSSLFSSSLHQMKYPVAEMNVLRHFISDSSPTFYVVVLHKRFFWQRYMWPLKSEQR